MFLSFWFVKLGVLAASKGILGSTQNFELITFNAGLVPNNAIPFYKGRREALKAVVSRQL